jgi:hypothetical protein
VNLHQLLRIAQNEFKKAKTIDEDHLEQDWPRLRAALSKELIKWNGELHRETKETLVSNLPLWRRHFLRLKNEK